MGGERRRRRRRRSRPASSSSPSPPLIEEHERERERETAKMEGAPAAHSAGSDGGVKKASFEVGLDGGVAVMLSWKERQRRQRRDKDGVSSGLGIDSTFTFGILYAK